ncbi:heterokaryon incompatibility protein-domain-containing protein [Hyaloscypha finlandica]|nr:heterokaryon incompatibility protein-domain-containing protein [Hyaloscypha finlandica]
MWLINVETMQLEDFTVRPAPQYAILSHTWSEEEVSLQEFTCQNADTVKKEGFAKIVRTCSLAAENHIKYAWVDTCCIDKSSSAELTEAINSMFQWYKNAVVCYAYLSDLSPRQDAVLEDLWVDFSRRGYSLASRNELQGCKWFTRGWTLQELIAPKTVRFYDKTWDFRGTKHDLAVPIESITHIGNAVLRGSKTLADIAIARRMAWASKRKTTRVEDVAYCLLGIFDVNMPLLYGEGNKAFTRLQEEIIKNNSDLSIFGWSPEESLISVDYPARFNVRCDYDCGHGDDNGDDFYSILATSPSEFLTPHSYNIVQSVEHSVTNRGIKIYCSLLEICLRGCIFVQCKCCGDNRKYVLVIGSVRLGMMGKYWGVVLDKISPDAFIRSGKHLIYIERDAFFAGQATPRAIYLLTQAPKSARHATLPLIISEGSDFIIQSAAPAEKWNSCKRYWYVEDGFDIWGMVLLKFNDLASFRDRGVCILVIFHDVYVLDPRVYGAEIRLISQAGSNLDWGDIGEIFDFESLRRGGLEVMDRNLKVMARCVDKFSDHESLEVWTEDIESDGRPARA